MKSILSRIILFGFLVFICFACSKNDKIERLEPRSYFPVFPGSYWKYLDSNGDTVVRKTGSDYIEDRYYVGGELIRGPHYVPLYEDTPIWEYYEHTYNPGHQYQSPGFVQILSESSPLGKEWEAWYYPSQLTKVSRKVVFRDSTIRVSGNEYFPTMMVEEFYSMGPDFYLWIYKRYYTEHVGLIKEESFKYSDSSIYTINLIDYHINY